MICDKVVAKAQTAILICTTKDMHMQRGGGAVTPSACDLTEKEKKEIQELPLHSLQT